MRYILYVVVNILFDLFAYAFSWAVPFFADKAGHVPAWLSWFTTHDHPSLDMGDEWNREKWPLIYNSGLPVWLKTYLYRVTWLYRNTGYGFAYDVLGAYVDPKTVAVKGDLWVTNIGPYARSGWAFCWDTSRSIWTRPWVLSAVYQYGKSARCLSVFLGWKFTGHVQNMTPGRAMLAMRISPYLYYDVRNQKEAAA